MYDFTNTKESLANIQARLEEDYKQISTGRANPALLDSIMVDSYGTKQSIKAVASINLEDARTLRISPWDKSQIGEIEQSLRDSGLPLSISSDDTGVRASVPQVTEENKEQLVKITKEKLEEARIRVRDERHKEIKEIEGGEATEDEIKDYKEELQKIIDSANTDLEDLFNKKKDNIMSV